MPQMVNVKATQVTPPPAWALLERKLIALLESSARLSSEKYADRAGQWYWFDDMDDYYERSYNWCLLYALGGDESLVDLALKHWNATTRLFDDRDRNRANYLDYHHGPHPMRFRHNIHNEYFSLAHPGDAEWHHMGEGNMAFYDLGVADPTISENMRRARRFAGMYIGEDPEAPNYDKKHRIIRSQMQGSDGPYLKGTKRDAMRYLHGGHPETPGWKPKPMGALASLYPVVKDLEIGWWNNEARAAQITDLFSNIVLNGDHPANLGATGLVTNAYLYTGDKKYKQWVLEYVEAWMDRIKKNNGIIPDNTGPTGKPGENREGVWWGGICGWNSHYGYTRFFHSVNVATECAVLLSGDTGYAELMRSQIRMLLQNSVKRIDGHLLTPVRVTKDGWYTSDKRPEWDYPQATSLRVYEPTHVYHLTMSKEDRDTILHLRDGDKERDWNVEEYGGDSRADYESEYARFQYYDGKNPDWPTKILSLEYELALGVIEKIKADDRSVPEIIKANEEPPNPVYCKSLVQLTTGSPHSVYHGGLLPANVRYFDMDRVRPGLPPDVAAFVDTWAPDRVGIQLVNTGRSATRRLIVQAGGFGQHQFTGVTYRDGDSERNVTFDGRYFSVELPPSTSIRVEAGMRRFVNAPSYAFPWHGGSVPAPFR
ncbi:MAG: hypothetical protein FJ319_11735 [SAR202 cluster bacterium]|nr:hypothetical protein [SAR202 cluster bacterium]